MLEPIRWELLFPKGACGVGVSFEVVLQNLSVVTGAYALYGLSVGAVYAAFREQEIHFFTINDNRIKSVSAELQINT